MQAFDAIKLIDANKKLEFYAQQFIETFNLANKIRTNSKFNIKENEIDLSESGFGLIQVETSITMSEELVIDGYDEGTPGYKRLFVWVKAFNPKREGRLVYTRPESLEDNSQHIEHDIEHPYYWTMTDGSVYFGDDGLHDEQDPNFVHLDEVIKLVLGFKETLQIIEEQIY